jgi:hypothetical protein
LLVLGVFHQFARPVPPCVVQLLNGLFFVS